VLASFREEFVTDDRASLLRSLRHLEQKLAAQDADLRSAQYEMQRVAQAAKRGQWAEAQLSRIWESTFGPGGAALWHTRLLGKKLQGEIERRIRRARNGAAERQGKSAIQASTASVNASGDERQPDIFCFPIIDWHFRYQRPQQLMSRLARRGRRVFWVAPWFRGAGPPVDVEELAPGVWEVSLRGPDLDLYGAAPDEATAEQMANRLVDLAREIGVGEAAQVVELPFWWPVVRRLREKSGWRVVYDCMDDYGAFSLHNAQTSSLEAAIIQTADVILASSRPLQEKIARSGRQATLVRNACDYEHFAVVTLRRSDRPVVGYYGAIADWFDSDLVADLAERRADWDFLLIGSTFSADVSRLRELPNVQLAGEKPYSDLPRWLSRFDVAILPFRRGPLTEATNPVKAYEIMAAGLPLVSVPLPEMVEFGDLVRLASTPEEFERQIRAELENLDESIVERRRAFARGQTWEERVRQVDELISSKA
jgi:glycosyltransferase involved in cell wall biosynthesis